jgi:hypothetical protein
MRRGWGIVAAILGVLLVVAIAAGAYHAGADVRPVDGGQVVAVGPGWHGAWFFPFGFLFFLLTIVAIVMLVRFAIGGPRWWHGSGYGPWMHGPWGDDARAHMEQRFDEWHRRQHEQGSTSPDPGGGSAS